MIKKGTGKIKGSQLIEENQKFRTFAVIGKAKIAIRILFKDARENIANGYPAIFNHDITIQATMHRKNGNKSYSRAKFFKEGKLNEAINPHFPDHYLTIKAGGKVLEKKGIQFKASGSLRKDCYNMAMSGFGFNLHTSR